jgi:outer membrane biosynthesis protein TonB
MHDQTFESRKNIRAGSYTLLICILLVIIFLFMRQTFPPHPVLADEGIEVNLGNSDQGLGEDQPLLPGQPSPQDNQSYTPPRQTVSEPEESKDIETDDKNDDAPEIKKPPVAKPEAKKIPEKDIVKNTPKKVTEPVTNPTPPAPKPKAVFKGVNGTGTGGNDADTYKKGGNQGIAGGTGDQGRPGGDPDSKNYKGGGKGTGGVDILRGLQNRNITYSPKFTDEFNENGKVAVDITVDGAGNVISARYQARGSTTSDADMTAIALRKARQVKFNSTGAESSGTIVFNFKLQN